MSTIAADINLTDLGQAMNDLVRENNSAYRSTDGSGPEDLHLSVSSFLVDSVIRGLDAHRATWTQANLDDMTDLAIGAQACLWSGNSGYHDGAKAGMGALIRDAVKRLKVETVEGFAVGDRVTTTPAGAGHGWMGPGDVGVVTTVEECESNGWGYTASVGTGSILVRREDADESTYRRVHRYQPHMLQHVADEPVPPSQAERASFPDIDQMPSEQRSNIGCHTDFVAAVKEWTTDGVDDIADGVDAQIEAFRSRLSFPDDSCGTLGSTKDWIGEVMKHKRHLLRLKVETPMVETDIVEVDPSTRVQAMERAKNAEIRAIFAALKDEAERRNWCSEYEDFLDKVDGDVSIDLDDFRRDQERDYEVSWSETYTITVSRSTTVTATDEEHAGNIVTEGDYFGDVSDYDIRNGYASITNIEYEDYDDVEVEEA